MRTQSAQPAEICFGFRCHRRGGMTAQESSPWAPQSRREYSLGHGCVAILLIRWLARGFIDYVSLGKNARAGFSRPPDEIQLASVAWRKFQPALTNRGQRCSENRRGRGIVAQKRSLLLRGSRNLLLMGAVKRSLVPVGASQECFRSRKKSLRFILNLSDPFDTSVAVARDDQKIDFRRFEL
jgi:hypothetical protein